MARRMVRFVSRVERGGLRRNGRAQQQQDKQGSAEGLPTARRFGYPAATK